MKTIVKKTINEPVTSINDLLFDLRGMSQEEVTKLLNPTFDDVLSPFGLRDMTKAINILMNFMMFDAPERAPIFIQVDSDVDGLTSAATMVNFLKLLLGEDYPITWNLHATKAHGINLDVIPENARLIIIPDAGSGQQEEHKKIVDSGKLLIILDHHRVSNEEDIVEIPDVALVNNQLSVDYENKFLSGVGIVFKFCEGFTAVLCEVDEVVGTEIARQLPGLLDLVAMGLIADSMLTTVGENAYYIQNGLANINNPGLKGLIKVQAYSLKNRTDLTITDISFYIAPLINAVFRVGKPVDKDILFRSFVEGDKLVQSTKRGESATKELVSEQAARHASNTKKRQTTALSRALIVVEGLIAEKIDKKSDFMQTAKCLMITAPEGTFPRSLTGLIAIKMLVKYNKPTFVLLEKDGYLSGSVRSFEYEHIPDVRKFCYDSDKVALAEGHPCAFGVGFKSKKDLEGFVDELNTKSIGFDMSPVVNVDLSFNAEYFTQEIVFELMELQPLFGKGFEEPKIGVTNIVLDPKKAMIMGADKTSSKFEINGVSLVRFKDKEFAEAITSALKSKKIMNLEIIGRVGINEWAGQTYAQLIIEKITKIETKFIF